MHDLLDPKKLEISPKGDTYSTYSLGILFGIIAVALNLVAAIIAAANVAIASHLSLHPPRREYDVESIFKQRLIFCMITQFAIAIVSGISLLLFSLNIDSFLGVCVGFFLFHGFLFLVIFVWQSLEFNHEMFKGLSTLSVVLSTLAFILAVARQKIYPLQSIVCFYFSTLIYHLCIHSQGIPTEKPHRTNIFYSFVLCLSWMEVSIPPLASHYRDPSMIILSAISGLEGILFAYLVIVGLWKKWRGHQRHIRGPTSPV